MASTKFSSRENVKVIIRYRPVNKIERKHDNDVIDAEPMTWDEKTHNIRIGKKRNKTWGFDGVAGPTVDQEAMFRIVAEKTCKDVLNGYNGTIFVFGQTGSGKTYTMYGAEDKPEDVSLMGVIPRCVSYIFNEIQADPEIDTFRVTCSFLEIYQEKPRDLLNNDKHQDLKIRLNKRHETYVQGLVEHQVESITDVLQLISIAVGNRVTDSHTMNAVSSRSHMLMKMTVVVKLKDGTIRIAAANFADLAGSEKVKKTGARGTRLDEAKSINKSLTVLGMVIHALSSAKKKHVPFRDSMLTHVLRDSLGGNCKTTLVVTVSPHKYNRNESINSLRFGRRCKLVTNKASVNRVFSNDELMRRLAMLEAKNEELQEMLKQKAYDAFQNSELPKQIEALQGELGEIREKLKATEGANDDLDKIIAELRSAKYELEDKSNEDMKQIEGLQARIKELEAIVKELSAELEKQRQNAEYMNNNNKLLEDKLEKMTQSNEDINAQIGVLQTDLSGLRQFKYDTQQSAIVNMMKQEQQRNEMNSLKQQIQQQSLQYQQQISTEKNATVSVQKELNLQQQKLKLLQGDNEKLEQEKESIEEERQAMEQEKMKYEQELVVKEKEISKLSMEKLEESNDNNSEEMKQEIQKKDIEEAVQAKEDELNAQYKRMVDKIQKENTLKLDKLQSDFTSKNAELQNEHKRKEQELADKEEILRNEIKQELTIQIKNETDKEFNAKMMESQSEFTSQLTGLQTALNEAHTGNNSMREEIEEERKKNKQLRTEDNTKSDKILEIRNENEQLQSELEHLRKQLAEEKNNSGNMTLMEEDYKHRMEEHDEEKDKLLQEQEALNRMVDDERRKIDVLKDEFQRKAELFGAKEKAQADLLHKEKQEKKVIKTQLTEHRGIITKSHHLLAKQNKLLKQRESKIYSLVEKQSSYLDNMNNLRSIQIGMDEDVAKRLLDKEAEVERARILKLEEQRRRDDEFVRNLLMREHKSVDNVDIKGNAKAKPKAKGRNKSGVDSKSVTIEYDVSSGDVEQLMQIANANSKSNLSQQIASVALRQQHDRLMGGKVKKSVLDLWIKSQMQLMCGQLPTLCKKYGVQLNKLNDMYGDKKRDYQPKIDQHHYLKFRGANWDPKEFETPMGDDMKDFYNGRGRFGKKDKSKNNNPLLPDAAGNDIFDPYGHYQNDRSGMRVAAKPQGFVAQPRSPSSGPIGKGLANDGYNLKNENIDSNGSGGGGKKKKFWHRKSKVKSEKKKKKSKKKEKKSKKKNKSGANSPSSPLSKSKSNSFNGQQMEFENGPAPVPYGQYLKNEDMQQFEKIQMNKNVELEEAVNMNKIRYPKQNNTGIAMDNSGDFTVGGHGATVLIHGKHESESSNESLDYDAAAETANNHQAVNATMIINNFQSKSQSHSREISVDKTPFDAVTDLVVCGEMGGIRVSAEFGLVHSKATVRLLIVNENVSGKAIHKLKVKFNRNYIGVTTTVTSINLLSAIEYKAKYVCNVPLVLVDNMSIMQSGLMNNNKFDFSAELIVNTNLYAIKCKLIVPIHLFFETKGSLPRDQFLSQWKAISAQKEAKLQIYKARSNDMQQIKSLLVVHKLFFIHHRNIPNKGNILYYSCSMYGQVLLCEISIALSGKGTVVVRSNDKYKSNLCVNAIQLVIDSNNPGLASSNSYVE